METIATELRQTWKDCTDRGLYETAKWATEQLNGIPESERCTNGANTFPSSNTAQDLEESDVYSMGMSYFHVREYRRCTETLKGCKGPRASFVRDYAQYMEGERKKREAMPLNRVDDRCALPVNMECEKLCNRLKARCEQMDLDPFGLYLYGVVLKALDFPEQARDVLCQAISRYPCLWCAWVELTPLCTSLEHAHSLPIPTDHLVYPFFEARLALQSNCYGSEARQAAELCMERFPLSVSALSVLANAHYEEGDYDKASDAFEELYKRDPNCREGRDNYSNILFCHEDQPALSCLAHDTVNLSRFSPEACIVVGNYENLRGESGKAVQAFERALRLDPKSLSAWILLGHEYVEGNNTAAAVRAYQRAIDLNPRDYRAWFGLGHASELMQMPRQALYSFLKASEIRPTDLRIRLALGRVYEDLDHTEDAIQCYEQCNPKEEEEVRRKLAQLYARAGRQDEAAHYHEMCIEDLDEPATPEDAESFLFLVQYHFQKGDLHEAEQLCSCLLHWEGPEREESLAVLRSLRQMRSHAHGASSSLPGSSVRRAR
eukprot:gnl/Trimastix_PCT/2112.p1 GENE.gnl/Trimastix_PCT/2112~~gnl/Trimastix_PCT/2112.p1  ORF type:complete len:548 (+),score=97.24 gnl/Trimastix_PCT/2112:108-1751(+)